MSEYNSSTESINESICIHKIVLCNNYKKNVFKTKGRVRKDETAAIIFSCTQSNLIEADTLVCENNHDEPMKYRIMGYGRDKRLESKDNPERPFVVRLSK